MATALQQTLEPLERPIVVGICGYTWLETRIGRWARGVHPFIIVQWAVVPRQLMIASHEVQIQEVLPGDNQTLNSGAVWDRAAGVGISSQSVPPNRRGVRMAFTGVRPYTVWRARVRAGIGNPSTGSFSAADPASRASEWTYSNILDEGPILSGGTSVRLRQQVLFSPGVEEGDPPRFPVVAPLASPPSAPTGFGRSGQNVIFAPSIPVVPALYYTVVRPDLPPARQGENDGDERPRNVYLIRAGIEPLHVNGITESWRVTQTFRRDPDSNLIFGDPFPPSAAINPSVDISGLQRGRTYVFQGAGGVGYTRSRPIHVWGRWGNPTRISI